MPTILTDTAIERSTFAIAATFTDEDGDPMTPATLAWTLTDMISNVINSRSGVAVTTPSSAETIVLSGADLARNGLHDSRRVLTLAGTYTSTLGSGLPFRNAVQFDIERDRTVSIVTVLGS